VRGNAKCFPAAVLFVCWGLGCAPVSPPPLFARHAGAAAPPEGTLTVTLAGGMGGADLGGGLGFELRVAWQVSPGLGLGVGLGTAAGGDPGGDEDEDAMAPPTRLLAVRGFGRVGSPDHEWAAATFGAGLAATTRGLVALTVDGGGVVSRTFGDTAEPSLGLAAALSLPVRQGEGLGIAEPVLPTTTVYLGGSLGLGVRLGDTDNTISAEVGAWRGFATGGARATVYALSFADAQGIDP
jgi:hypothetical protein